jgi:hypothetical protein
MRKVILVSADKTPIAVLEVVADSCDIISGRIVKILNSSFYYNYILTVNPSSKLEEWNVSRFYGGEATELFLALC